MPTKYAELVGDQWKRVPRLTFQPSKDKNRSKPKEVVRNIVCYISANKLAKQAKQTLSETRNGSLFDDIFCYAI